MPDATPPAGFACPDLSAFCRLDELGLVATGQRLEPDPAVLAYRVVEPDQWCRDLARRPRRGSTLGFRNLTNYVARSLLETGGFGPQLHPHLG